MQALFSIFRMELFGLTGLSGSTIANCDLFQALRMNVLL
jgi:hypothetical protein